jgi:hypothetical protein
VHVGPINRCHLRSHLRAGTQDKDAQTLLELRDKLEMNGAYLAMVRGRAHMSPSSVHGSWAAPHNACGRAEQAALALLIRGSLRACANIRACVPVSATWGRDVYVLCVCVPIHAHSCV